MNLRDHDHPCEHGFCQGHDYGADFLWCPGGAVVVIDYQAAAWVWHKIPMDQRYDHSRNVSAVVDAALGGDAFALTAALRGGT